MLCKVGLRVSFRFFVKFIYKFINALLFVLFSAQECKETLGQFNKAYITPMCIAKVLGRSS